MTKTFVLAGIILSSAILGGCVSLSLETGAFLALLALIGFVVLHHLKEFPKP